MEENTWRFCQILMWFFAIQTTILVCILGFMWKSIFNIHTRFYNMEEKFEKRFDKIDQRFQKVDEKLESIHGRICHLEGASEKQIYVLKEENQVRKAK